MSVQDRICSLSPAHKALLDKLLAERRAAAPARQGPPAIARVTGPDGAGDWPLSFDQERLWVLSLLDPEGTTYNLLTATRLLGELDVPALHAALREIVRRQGALRTTFPAVDGAPLQRVAPSLDLALPIIDLTALPPALREPAARGLVRAATRQPFSLERGPLVRVTLIRLDAREHFCLAAIHHILSDQITFHLFWRELALVYGACAAGLPLPLAELPIQYADYVVWQRGWLQGETLERDLGWWQEQLRGFPQVLDIPADRPRPASESLRGRRQRVRLDPGLTRGLRELALHEKATRFMTVAALSAALFHRLSGQDRLIAGTLNANRNRIELEPLFGFFLTQLPLAIDLTGDPPFRELLARVRGVALGAYAHQDLPFGKLVEVMQPERELGRMPLVQALIQLFELPAAPPADPRLRFEPIEVHDENTRYDLMLAVTDDVETIHGDLESNAEIFDATTTLRIIELFLAQAAAVAADPSLPLSALPAFPPALRQQMLLEWNDTAEADGPDLHATVVDQFQAQAARTPAAPAWRGDGWSLTYAELDELSGRLARHLRRRGAGPEVLIGIFLERSAELPVALLGVLRAGAAYLPLDTAHPIERRSFVLEDAGAALVLTQERLIADLPAGIPTLCLDLTDPSDRTDPSDPLPSIDPNTRAYVIYTSGSTGRPKGVEIAHRSLANFVQAMRELYYVESGDSMPAITTIAFDLSVPELYLPMLGGGTTPLLSRDTAADGALLARALDDRGATVLQATPTTYRLLLEAGWPGRPELLLLCGAEAMSRDLADQLLPLGRGLWNFYGPTETTVWSTAWRVERGTPISIGRPIAATRIYLLDRRLAPVPLGAVGEIAIGGASLARGYLRRPDLTADRFVPNPFSEEPGARLYRTGDLGRLRRDGLLDHLGRADHQIKLRGYRIEPGEIEAALRAHPSVAEAVVLLREERLVAWLGLAPGAAPPDTAELRELLRRELPEYMVPSAFVPLPALPRNANGKLDRKALPAPEGWATRSGGEPVAPRDEIEAEMAAIWQRLLGVERVGVFDNFFELGGHSLLANRVVAAVRQSFQVEVPLRALFLEPTVAGLADAVNRAQSGSRREENQPLRIERQPRTRGVQRFPVSFSQLREWILDRLEPGTPAYNVPMPMRVSGPLSIPVLRASVQEIVRRHESLRTTFESGPEEPLQVVAPAVAPAIAPHLELPVGIADLSALPGPQREAELQRLLAEDLGLGFDLSFPKGGPLLRARIVRLAPEDHAGLFTLHHIISDGWSIGVFLRDLGAIYEAFAQGRPSPLPELPLQYPDFAVWQRNRLQGAVLDEQIGYWRERLTGMPPLLELPADRPRPPVRSSRGAELPAALPRPLVEALRGLAAREGGSLFMALLAGWQTLLARLSGEDDVCVGTFSSNRPRVELEGLIGFFVNTLPLRTDRVLSGGFRELLGRVSEVTLGTYAHQEIPFEKLLESLAVPRDPARTPLFQTMLVLQNFPRQGIELSQIELAPLAFQSQRANFDITLWLSEESDRSVGLSGHLDYSTDLFDETTIVRLLAQLRTLLEAAVAEPDRDLRDLPLLAPAERAEIVEGWSRTEPEPEGEPLLHRLFELQAARSPEAIAVEAFDGTHLTYAELDRQAERLARRLRRLGVGPEARVGLAVERSPEMLVGMLGILKAGGAYVPLDPAYPQERLAFMLEDSGAVVLLKNKDIKDLKDSKDSHEAGSSRSLEPLQSLRSISPDHPAYVIYTSGSTGRPKGVVVSHRSIAAYTRTARQYYAIGPSDRVLQFGSISFDTSAEEIYPALAAGGTLVLRAGDMALSMSRFLSEAGRLGITVLALQTAFWHEIVAGLAEGLELPSSLRLVAFGGEEALTDRLAAWRRRVGTHVRLVNTYGPTEATIVSTYRELAEPEDDPEVPIGRPIPGARTYVLDRRFEPVPPGVQGELMLGGGGVARGYLGRPDLTAERFVPDPFGAPGARLYRTGDLACFRPGGELLFRGRADRQLKLRGYRIEPGEIEVALRLHPALHDAVADLRGRGDDKRLIAWVIPREGETAPAGPELRAFLRDRLPDALVPALFVPLAALPLTASGKLDLRALPEPAAVRSDLPGYAEPATALERTIAGIFRALLRVDRVGLHDNFFDLGGHSLLVIRAHQKLAEELGREIPVVDLFRFPTVAQLARHLGGEAAGPSLDRVQSLAEQQRAAQQRAAAQLRQKQALEKLRRPEAPARR
jgi:amino acid adenylation domain-containing protein